MRRQWILCQLLISCLAGASRSLSDSFIGCYEDKDGDYLQYKHPQELSTNSPLKCTTLCNSFGFLYAGVKLGNQCTCGDVPPPLALLEEYSEHHTNCLQKAPLKTTGNTRIAVYDTDITDIPLLGMKIGCFDNREPVLQEFKIQLPMTNCPRRCGNLCRSLGYQYAGVQQGVQCYCGSTVYTSNARGLSDGDCSHQCPGNELSTCGSDYNIEVYFTGLKDPEPVAIKVGCISAQDWSPAQTVRWRIRLDPTQTPSPNKCVQQCYNKGFLHSSFFNSSCWCAVESSPGASGGLIGSSQEAARFTAATFGKNLLPEVLNDESVAAKVECSPDRDSSPSQNHSRSVRQDPTLTSSPQRCDEQCRNKGFRINRSCCCEDESSPGTTNELIEGSEDASRITAKCEKGKIPLIEVVDEAPIAESWEERFVGCYKDSVDRLLPDHHQHFLKLTPLKCIKFCQSMGFLYSGVEFSHQCYCADNPPLPPHPEDLSECNMECAGNATIKCGGVWRISVYKTFLKDRPSQPVEDRFLGCFNDNPWNYLLTGHFTDLYKNSPLKCNRLCNAMGYLYSGVEHGHFCFCGDDRLPRNPQPRSECNTNCNGDGSIKCGGFNHIQVYRTDVKAGAAKSWQDSFLGCYRDVEDHLLADHHQYLPKLTPLKCMRLCQGLGYQYSGMKFSHQCFCADNPPLPSHPQDPSECNMKCAGNATIMCGGWFRISVYKTDKVTPSTSLKVGCVDNNNSKVLQDYAIRLEPPHSPRRCTNLCRSLGYDYAAVEQCEECYCGNNFHTNSSGNDDCSNQCPGQDPSSCVVDEDTDQDIDIRSGYSDPTPPAKQVDCFTAVDRFSKLHYRWRVKQDFNQPPSPQSCADFCNDKGYQYSTIYNTVCWCADKVWLQATGSGQRKESYNPPSAECDNGKIALFEVINAVSLGKLAENYLGCFTYDEGDSALGAVMMMPKQLTPERCVEFCFNKGFLYAGTKNKNQCHCGDMNSYDSGLTLVSDEGKECSLPCSGDDHKHCGGTSSVAAYSTGIPDVPETDKLVGCFQDDEGQRAVTGHKTDLGLTNSPRRCLNYCRRLGYLYAGNSNKKECICFNSLPPTTQQVPVSQCNSTCPGGGSQTCGGVSSTQVYRTGLLPSPIPGPESSDSQVLEEK